MLEYYSPGPPSGSQKRTQTFTKEAVGYPIFGVKGVSLLKHLKGQFFHDMWPQHELFYHRLNSIRKVWRLHLDEQPNPRFGRTVFNSN